MYFEKVLNITYKKNYIFPCICSWFYILKCTFSGTYVQKHISNAKVSHIYVILWKIKVHFICKVIQKTKYWPIVLIVSDSSSFVKEKAACFLMILM